MKLILVSVSARAGRAKQDAAATLTADYIARSSRMVEAESTVFPTEAALLAFAERQPGRPAALIVCFDSHGEQLSSEDFASYLGRLRDDGAQRILFAIGPADGWAPAALAKAAKVVAFGRITLPHELARVVAAEQIYRALTILAGHPYHSGH